MSCATYSFLDSVRRTFYYKGLAIMAGEQSTNVFPKIIWGYGNRFWRATSVPVAAILVACFDFVRRKAQGLPLSLDAREV